MSDKYNSKSHVEERAVEHQKFFAENLLLKNSTKQELGALNLLARAPLTGRNKAFICTLDL